MSCQDLHNWLYAQYYLFLQGVFQHLGYFISLDSQPCPICTFTQGIRYDLEGPFIFGCLRCFPEKSLKCSANFLNRFRTSWRICSIRYLQGSPILPPVLRLSYRYSSSAPFWGFLIVPIFSLILGGSSKFLEGLFRSCECVPGSILSAFSYRCLFTKKASMIRLSPLRRRLNIAVFTPFFMRRRG